MLIYASIHLCLNDFANLIVDTQRYQNVSLNPGGVCNDGDESTHQILSYGLLFSNFYHFSYTADPPTSTVLTRPFLTIVRTFAQTLMTLPYTSSHHWPGTTSETSHMTYGPHCYLSLFSFTQDNPLQPDRSQVVTPHDQDLIIHLAAPKPCAHFTYHLYLRLL